MFLQLCVRGTSVLCLLLRQASPAVCEAGHRELFKGALSLADKLGSLLELLVLGAVFHPDGGHLLAGCHFSVPLLKSLLVHGCGI